MCFFNQTEEKVLRRKISLNKNDRGNVSRSSVKTIKTKVNDNMKIKQKKNARIPESIANEKQIHRELKYLEVLFG